jgi:hypothetical protein
MYFVPVNYLLHIYNTLHFISEIHFLLLQKQITAIMLWTQIYTDTGLYLTNGSYYETFPITVKQFWKLNI